jgi:hypothetical protein
MPVGKLFAPDGKNSDSFGRSVAIDGAITVIGAMGVDTIASSSGAAYVYQRVGRSSWIELAKLVPDDLEKDDNFGRSASLSGNLAVFGTRPNDPDNPKPGAAYLYAVGPDDDGDDVMGACVCTGDLDQDWSVGQSDLGMLLAAYGSCPGDPIYSAPAGQLFPADPCVTQSDLGVLLARYGAVCP